MARAMIFAAVFAIAAQAETLDERLRAAPDPQRWTKRAEIPLAFDAHHLQGMEVVAGKIYLTAVEVIDRTKGAGEGWLFEMGMDGALLRSARIGEGKRYHPGGLDFDGTHLWTPVAEYRPDSSASVLRIDPATLAAEKVLEIDDHLGAVVPDRDGGALIGVSWGSRRYYRWSVAEKDGRTVFSAPEAAPNPAFYIDYQDGQSIPGTPYAIFYGLRNYRTTGEPAFSLGGIELVDLRALRPILQIPITLRSASGRVLTQNPCFAEANPAGGLTLYFIPDDGRAVMYIYDTNL